jgi:Tol biopolymer transport system component
MDQPMTTDVYSLQMLLVTLAGWINRHQQQDSSGSGFRFLTFSGFTDGASWSPDSKRVAFTKDSALYIINGDGSGMKKVTTTSPVFPGKPSWSPDGKNLAFAAFAPTATGQAVQIFRIADDGTNLKQLTNEEHPANEPSWSPDGARIVYSYSASENEIYAMKAADGSNKTNLSNSPASSDISPSWEKNGGEILYLRYTGGNENERSDLYRMASDGSNQKLINRLPTGSTCLFHRTRRIPRESSFKGWRRGIRIRRIQSASTPSSAMGPICKN